MVDFTKPSTIRWLGPNLEKGKRTYENEVRRARREFLKKYPHAKIDQFEFRPSINDQGNLVQLALIYYIGDGNTFLPNYNGTIASSSWPITSRTFKEKYSSALYSGPTIIWSPGGVKQPFVRSEATLPFNLSQFSAYVSKDQSFTTNFPKIATNWVNQEGSKDILRARFNTSDPYFNSVASAYVLSTMSGVCKKHFETQKDVPKIITSVLCYFLYFLYYHMARFSHDPTRLDQWLGPEDYEKIQSLIPTRGIWEQRYVYGSKEIPVYWYRRQPAAERAKIKAAGYLAIDKYGGSRAIKYLYRTKVENKSDVDWMSFIQDESEGFTRRGQLLLQEAIESYVYAVLGSQARTRSKIVGAGARSSQTQQIFQKIVKDTIAQDDDSVLIAKMRTSIKSTNVVLDTAIIPGVVLIPSSMLIVNKPIPGYNNILTTATKQMGFGTNDKINFQGFVKKKKKKMPECPEEEEEKFSHTLTITSQESSEDDKETPTNTTPPPLVLSKGEDDDTLEVEKKDDHWDVLSNTFVMVLVSVLVTFFLLKR